MTREGRESGRQKKPTRRSERGKEGGWTKAGERERPLLRASTVFSAL